MVGLILHLIDFKNAAAGGWWITTTLKGSIYLYYASRSFTQEGTIAPSLLSRGAARNRHPVVCIVGIPTNQRTTLAGLHYYSSSTAAHSSPLTARLGSRRLYGMQGPRSAAA